LGAISNVPYLTPQELPEDDDCRPLFIPAGSEWLALFGGALTELVQIWNWEDSGGLSVADTIEKMQEIIDRWYIEACENCEIPEGGSILRITPDGTLEELVEGEWVEPTEGDYFIPPPAAREDGSETDQICLAAINAVNVLQTLYESLSDSWNNALDEAEAVTAFIAAANAAIGFAFAPIVAGIVVFLAPIFTALYTLLEYVIADLWDEAVSDQIKCFLVNCATNTDGVVTFDYECFLAEMRANTNLFDLTEEQLRLYGQIAYMLYFIGGAAGLNLAGGTTAIEEGDCEGCVDCEDYSDTMDDELGPKTSIAEVDPANGTLPILPATSPLGTYSTGTLAGKTGYIAQGTYNGAPGVAILVDLGMECEITAWSVDTYSTDDDNLCNGYHYFGMLDADFAQIGPSYGGGCWGADSAWRPAYQTAISVVARYFFFHLYGSSGSTVAIKEIAIVTNNP